MNEKNLSKIISSEANTPNASFDELLEAFMLEKKLRVRMTTYIGYETLSRRLILPYFTGRIISSIRPADIRSWQNRIMAMDFTPQYQRRIDTLMVSILNYGMRFFDLQTNAAKLAGTMGCWRTKSVNFWTLKEFNRFITYVRSPLTRLAFMTLYWTGMRCGELLALTPRDIDFKACTISITKSLKRYHKQDIVLPPKTEKSKRVVFIHKKLRNQFRDYLGKLTEEDLDKRIFPFTPEVLYSEMERSCRTSGVKRIKIHDLRHSHASLLIEMNVTPLLISERLGHEKVETTLNIYSHLYPNKQKQLSTKLEALDTY